MDKDEKRILIELFKRDSVLGEELAFLIHKSSRSVRKIIRTLNDELSPIQASILSGTNFGYRLTSHDPERLKALIDGFEDLHDSQDENRVQKIFNILADEAEYIKIEDLCDRMYLSRTQLKQSLANLRTFIKLHHLEIDVKPHYGIRLMGDEFEIRKTISTQLIESDFRSSPFDYQSIKDIVASCLVNTDYLISDDALNDLVKQLSIQCRRITLNCLVLFSDKQSSLIEHELEYSIAQQIFILLNKIHGVHVHLNEIAYLTMHLSGKNANVNTSIYVDKDAFYFIEEILKVLEEQSIYHFSQDLNLRMALAQHMIPLRKRIQYSLFLKNPLLVEIKTRLLEAYDLAIKASSVINEAYRCNLPEDEIAYFALHINLSLEQNKSKKKKSKILLICTGGKSSTRLIEYFFRTNFESYIDDLDICSLQELNLESLVQYDCVFSTVELPKETKSPVFMIDMLLGQNDAYSIKQNLTQLAKKKIVEYFPKPLFFNDISLETKTDIIHFMVEKCKEFYDLPSDFESKIWEREEISSTEYNDLVAFPHATQSKTQTTFVAVCVLNQPITWLNGKVRIILLSLVEERPNKEMNHFYGVISNILTNEQIQWKLINDPTYDQFIQIVEKIEATL